MATTVHGTLPAGQVTAVTVEAGRSGGVVVINRNQEGVIWVRTDGVDPQIEGAGSYAVFAVREFMFGRARGSREVTLNFLSDEERPYTVEGF